jgi:hypothetical protein
MLLYEVRSTGVARDGDGVEVVTHVCKLPHAIGSCLKPLLVEFDIALVDAVHFEPNLAISSVAQADGGLLDEEAVAESLSKVIRNKCEESIQRHADAFARQEALVRNSLDPHILKLNQLAWNAKKVGAELWILPRTPYEWRFDPTDPAQLLCAFPMEVVDSRIDDAEVLGVREVLQRQRDFWNAIEEIDAIITLNHRIPEIRHRMNRSDAQALWAGVTRISATVRRRGDELPIVVGDITKTCASEREAIEA